MTFLTRILYASACDETWGEHELDYILFLKKDVDFIPNPNEVKATEYVKQEDLKDFVASAETNGGVTPWFSLIARDLLPEWWAMLEKRPEMLKNDGLIHDYAFRKG